MPAPQNAQSEEKTTAQFSSLPGPLRSFLLSPESHKTIIELYKKLPLPSETIDQVARIVADIIYRVRPYGDLLPALTQEIKVPLEIAKSFALEVSGKYFLPIEDLIEANVWNQIEAWDGDPKKYPVKKVAARQVTSETLVEEIIKESRLALSERLMKRLHFIITSHTKGVRNDLEVHTMLTRAEKVGGVELSLADAEHLISIMRLKLANAQIVTEAPTPVLPAKKPTPPPSQKSIPPVRAPQERPNLSEAFPAARKFADPNQRPLHQNEEDEIQTIKTAMEQLPPPATHAHTLEECIKSIVKESGIATKAPTLLPRFEHVVSARLRDVRDARETKALLIALPEKAGLGLSLDEAGKIANIIEAEVFAFQGRAGAEKTREQIMFEQTKQHAQQFQAARAAHQTKQGLDQTFRAVVEKSKAFKEQEILLPPHPPELELPPHGISPKRQPVQPRKPEPPKPKPTMRPVLSPASVGPFPNQKPKMQDIHITRKTTGPIEEIRGMTTVQFRRLSKDPKEATLKIRDMIELLKEEGFEKYDAGIRAWQTSEPYRQYAELTRNALNNGISVSKVIEKQMQASEPTLTPEEFQAILAFNRSLRFSS